MRKTFALFFIILLAVFFINIARAETDGKSDNIDALKKIDEKLENIKKSPEVEQIGVVVSMLKNAEAACEAVENSIRKFFNYARGKIMFLKNLAESKEKTQNILNAGKKEGDRLFKDNGFEIKKYFEDKINLIRKK